MKNLVLGFLLLVCLVVTGCGSGDNDFVVVTDGGGPASSSTLSGKVFAGVPISGATVQLQSLDGQVLASQLSDETGNFQFEQQLPENLRVVASTSSGFELRREVRGLSPERAFAAVTVPTTLASLRVDGGAALEDAENQVRALLGMPAGAALDMIEESASQPFSHLAFFVEAARRGDTLEELLQAASQAQPGDFGPFLLRADTLLANLGSLPEPLKSQLTQFASEPRVQLSVRSLASRGVDSSLGIGSRGEGSPLPLNVVAQVGELADLVLVDFIGGAVADSLLDTGYTYVAEYFGWHYGTTATLDEIVNQLNSCLGGITALESTLTESIINDGATACNDAVNDIAAQTNNLIAAYNKTITITDYYSNAPTSSSQPTEVQTFLDNVTNGSTITTYENQFLPVLQQYMTGTASAPVGNSNNPFPIYKVDASSNYDPDKNMIALSRNYYLSQYGIVVDNDTKKFSDFPVRNNFLLDKALQVYEHYARYEVLGANVLAEAVHAAPDPLDEIPEAQILIDNLVASLQAQRGQIPNYASSDRILIDLQNGLIWYMDLQAERTNADAHTYAENFQLYDSNGNTTYGDWRLPTYNEALTLQQRGCYAAAVRNGSVDYGNTVSGLESLGFSLNGISGDGDIWCDNWKYDDGLFGSDTWSIDDNQVLTCKLNGEDFNYGFADHGPDGDLKVAFLMVMTIGQPLIPIDPPIGGGSHTGSWPSALTAYVYPYQMSEIAAFVGWDTPSVSAGQVNLRGKWTFYTGDTSFPVGNGTTISDQGGTYTTSSSGPWVENIIPPAYFETDFRSSATVSSYPGNFGQVFTHISNAATQIRYNAVGYNGSTYPANIQGSVNSVATTADTSLKSFQITPRNVSMNLIGNNAVNTQLFVATGFLNDRTAVDLSVDSSTVWTVGDANNNNAPIDGVAFAQGQKNQLVLNIGTLQAGSAANLLLRVTATTQGKTDSTLVSVVVK